MNPLLKKLRIVPHRKPYASYSSSLQVTVSFLTLFPERKNWDCNLLINSNINDIFSSAVGGGIANSRSEGQDRVQCPQVNKQADPNPNPTS